MRWRFKSNQTPTTFQAPEGVIDVIDGLDEETSVSNTAFQPQRILPSSTPNSEASAPPAKLKSTHKVIKNEKMIVFGILVILSSILATVGGMLNLYYKKALVNDYDHYGNTMAHMVAEQVVLPMQVSQVKLLANRMIQVNPDIAGIQFYDAQHRLLYGLKRQDVPFKVFQKNMQYSIPLRVEKTKQIVGQVVLTLTEARLNELRRLSQPILIVPFTSAWILTILVIMVMTYIWMKQLELIVNAVQRLSKGEFGVRLPTLQFTGLQRQLAEDINEMSRRLKIYEDHNIETILFERRKLEASLQSIVDGVVVCGTNDEIVFMNDAGVRLLDLQSVQSAAGQSILNYQDDQGKTPFTDIVQAFKDSLSQLPTNSKEGDDAWFMTPFSQVLELRPELALQIIVAPLRQVTRSFKEDFSMGGYVLIMHNITREREVDKLKTAFISNVSHELRTPVTTIKSYVDTLYHHRNELDAPTQNEFFETLHVETERLKKLVNDILDFSRLDEGQVQLHKEWESITPLISLTIQSVKVLAQQKKISISTALESDLPNVYIHTDSLERVMLNLLSNAIKYTPESGHIKVKAELTPERNGVMVSVQDTGIGISPQHLAHLFDRFYRVENKVHTVKGTGLGLHLVKLTIEKHHGGRVFVESTEGQGSIFGFILPLKNETSDFS